MTIRDFDVLIVGSGLAGLSAALHLAPTHRVAILTITLFTAIATPAADPFSMFLLAILGISALVIVHEGGHYLAARIFGMRQRLWMAPAPPRKRGAAKAAVIAFVQAVAVEYRAAGVRCNAVLPSVIDTPANRDREPDADTSKWVPPEQVAAVIRFLCSDDSAPTSGAAIPVYGRA